MQIAYSLRLPGRNRGTNFAAPRPAFFIKQVILLMIGRQLDDRARGLVGWKCAV
jgi:hypothetical protein